MLLQPPNTTGSLREMPLNTKDTSPPTPLMGNLFRFDGNDVTVCYGAEFVLRANSPGLFYIAFLLQHPNHKVSVSKLRQEYLRVAKVSGRGKSVSQYDHDQTREACLGSGASEDDMVIDGEAIINIRQKIDELDQEIEKATRRGDMMDLEKLRCERQELAHWFATFYQPNGKLRKLHDQRKRDRDAVCNAIARTLRKIQEKSPSLYRHLSNSLKRGHCCSYEPEKAMVWN